MAHYLTKKGEVFSFRECVDQLHVRVTNHGKCTIEDARIIYSALCNDGFRVYTLSPAQKAKNLIKAKEIMGIK